MQRSETVVPLPKLMHEAELAEYLGKSKAWLQRNRWTRDESTIPFVKIGSTVFYDKADVTNWLVSNRIGGTGCE